MKELITYVGLDVRKETIAVALAEAGKRNEVRAYGSNGSDVLHLCWHDVRPRWNCTEGGRWHCAIAADPRAPLHVTTCTPEMWNLG